jgi:type VI secretion system protein ImpJ
MANPDSLPDRIQWHEGMLLSPQHFQHESGRVDAMVAWQALASNPYGWGVRKLEIDEPLLSAGALRILTLEAVMPDGSAVTYSAQDSEGNDLQIDLTPLAEQLATSAQDVYLTVARSRSMRDPRQPSRFKGIHSQPVEDEISQALPADVPRMRMNLGLSVGAMPTSLLMSMKLFIVEKDNEVFKRGRFEPAMLEVPADNPIRIRAAAVAADIRSKTVFVCKQTSVPSSKLEDRLSLLEQRGRLSNLSMMLPLFEGVLRSPVVTPYALYLALCLQVGSLTMLRPGTVPLMPPPWNHADPLSSIEPLLQSVEELAAEVSQDWRIQLFSFAGEFFMLKLRPEWMSRQLVIGLRGQVERDLMSWMNGAVIGSKTVWPALSDRRVIGAARTQIDEAPALGVRSSAGYLLYSIEVTADAIVPNEALVIGNRNESGSAQRPQELVLFVKG